MSSDFKQLSKRIKFSNMIESDMKFFVTSNIFSYYYYELLLNMLRALANIFFLNMFWTTQTIA